MPPVFLYDGDCGFCSSCARFIRRRMPGAAEVVPWQRADLAALGVSEARADAAVQWVAFAGGRPLPAAAGPAAIAALMRAAGSYWRPLGVLLGTRPVLAVARPVYRWVARHRDRMPGGTAACALPADRRTPHGSHPT